MSRRSLIILLWAVLIAVVCYDRNSQDPHARYVASAYEQIDRTALFQPTDEELVAGAMRGMVEVLRGRGDEHSGYSDPRNAQRLRAEIRQEFGGVGVRIRYEGEPPRLTIVGPPEPNTPASRAGLQAGDVIDAIDGAPTDELDTAAARDMMRGEVGQPVVLTIVRVAADGNNGNEDEPQHLTVPLVRDEIQVLSVIGDRRAANGDWHYRLLDEPRIALLRLTSFGNKTRREVQTLTERLMADGVAALVFDLRGNPGGALDVALDVSDLFLPPRAPIVETRGRHNQLLEKFVARGGPFRDVPLAVLIDRDSASAAEIMAACLQDNGRATVVGERSFGKGTVQQLLPTESGRTLLKLTVAKYWRPSGANIHRMPGDTEADEWGVRPDPGFAVQQTEEQAIAWRVWRTERDLRVFQPTEQATGDTGAEKAENPDPVLATAVALLRSRFDGDVE